MPSTTIVSPEEAAKMTEEKTKQELEKLQQTLKAQGPKFEDYKNPSDIEDDDSSQSWCSESDTESDSDSESDYVKKPKRKAKHPVSMDTRMYNDNQKLWKRIQKLEGALSKSDKELRYLKYEYNNKCIEITELQDKTTKLNDAIKKHVSKAKDTDKEMQKMTDRRAKDTILLFGCYLYIFLMIVNYKFEVPVFDFGYKVVRESVTFFSSLLSMFRTEEYKMFLLNKKDGGFQRED